MKRHSPEVRALARRIADVAAEARLDGLAAPLAAMAAALYVARRADMTSADIADWLRRLAEEAEEAEGE